MSREVIRYVRASSEQEAHDLMALEHVVLFVERLKDGVYLVTTRAKGKGEEQ